MRANGVVFFICFITCKLLISRVFAQPMWQLTNLTGSFFLVLFMVVKWTSFVSAPWFSLCPFLLWTSAFFVLSVMFPFFGWPVTAYWWFHGKRLEDCLTCNVASGHMFASLLLFIYQQSAQFFDSVDWVLITRLLFFIIEYNNNNNKMAFIPRLIALYEWFLAVPQLPPGYWVQSPWWSNNTWSQWFIQLCEATTNNTSRLGIQMNLATSHSGNWNLAPNINVFLDKFRISAAFPFCSVCTILTFHSCNC